jgi:aryl-alcohol dehydrogenase-like predicted oxidoreductase
MEESHMPQAMPTAILGRTGLSITRLGYGGAHRRPQTDESARVVHEAVLNAGINFIDTADDYGNSEELIGRFLSGRSSEFYLATKCGSSDSGHVWTRENCLRNVDESLRRLKSDHVDVMQLHNPSVAECESGGLVEALQEMKRQGKVRWIGASTTLPHLSVYLEWGVFDVFQIPYSALERDHEDWIRKAAEAGIGIVIRGGVALGEPGAGIGKAERWEKFEEAGLDELRDEGDDRTAFLLRYTLTHPHADTIIVGTTNTDHLRQNVDAVLRGPLTSDTYAEAKRRLDATGVRAASVD